MVMFLGLRFRVMVNFRVRLQCVIGCLVVDCLVTHQTPESQVTDCLVTYHTPERQVIDCLVTHQTPEHQVINCLVTHQTPVSSYRLSSYSPHYRVKVYAV